LMFSFSFHVVVTIDMPFGAISLALREYSSMIVMLLLFRVYVQ